MAISINLYLDQRFANQVVHPEEQEFPVKVTITKDGATAYLPTGVRILPHHWKDRHVTGRKDKVRLNDYLDSFKSQVRNLVREGLEEERYQFMSATEIKNDIGRRLGKGEGKKSRSALFFSVYDKFAESRSSSRTKEIYRVTGRKIRLLLPCPERIRLDQIDLDWLENLDELLVAKGNSATTRSIDFRNIRAALRYAQKHKLLQENPFDDYVIPVGESPNRALTAEQFRTLVNADVESWERKYLDFFVLSFCLIGMNTEDGVLTSQRNRIMAMILEPKPNLYGLDYFDMFCMVNLESIPVETGADIIVSSSWRRLSKETLIRVWEHNGRCSRRLVGITPVENQAKRDAIEAWIAAHPDDRYVILDSEDLRLRNQVRTDPEVGLTLKDAREAISILNND